MSDRADSSKGPHHSHTGLRPCRALRPTALDESLNTDGLSRRRYRDATVVKVPPGELEAFHKFNKHMCESDALLPSFSSDMRYALLTKNRLVHAIELYAGALT